MTQTCQLIEAPVHYFTLWKNLWKICFIQLSNSLALLQF